MPNTFHRRLMNAEQRFWSLVDPCRTDGEMLWVGHIDSYGYGIFWNGEKSVKAHRWIYEVEVGPIPEGLTIDHVRNNGCTHRNCVWPSHLEPVTNRENILRSEPGKALNAWHLAKTHCPHGHAYDEENTYRDKNGGRYCRECHRIAGRISYARAKTQP